ncbi:hypothetical protein [Rhodoferax sp.]|uniref:hypothetical protein n=1 Tax=Rhodoferax sp. TaxID=50421 RepID=UPI003BAE2766
MNSPVIVKVAVIANAVKQSMTSEGMDRHVTMFLAMTVLFASLRAKRGSPCSPKSWIATLRSQ